MLLGVHEYCSTSSHLSSSQTGRIPNLYAKWKPTMLYAVMGSQVYQYIQHNCHISRDVSPTPYYFALYFEQGYLIHQELQTGQETKATADRRGLLRMGPGADTGTGGASAGLDSSSCLKTLRDISLGGGIYSAKI